MSTRSKTTGTSSSAWWPAYNSTYNASVNASPYFLMLGRHPPSVRDVLVNMPPGFQSQRGEHLRHVLKSTLSSLYAEVSKQHQSNMTSNQLDEDRLKVGDQVLILDVATPTGFKAKLRRRWTGPFIITAVTGPRSYIVNNAEGTAENRAHRDHLKLVYPGTSKNPSVWPDQTLGPAAAGVSSDASSPAISLLKHHDQDS